MLALQCIFIRHFFSPSIRSSVRLSSGRVASQRTRRRRREPVCGPMTQRSCDGLVKPHPSLSPFHSGGRRSGSRRAAGSLAAHITASQRKEKNSSLCLCQFPLWATKDVCNFNYLGKQSKVFACVCSTVTLFRTSGSQCGFLSPSFILSLSLISRPPRGLSGWSCQAPSQPGDLLTCFL